MQNITYIISDIDRAIAFEWIAEQLDRKKFNLSFIILAPNPPYLHSYLQQQGVPSYWVRHTGTLSTGLTLVRVMRLLRKLKTEVVHCHLFNACVIGLTAARMVGIKKRVYTRHHSTYHLVYHPGMVKWDRYCNRLATHIVAISEVVVKTLHEKERVDPAKITLIRHGFKLDDFRNCDEQAAASMRQKYNPENKRPVVGVISRFIEWKGVQYIVPAFNKLLATWPNACLVLFNSVGDHSAQIDALLSELPANSYKKVPFEKDVAAIYSLFDVFVHTPVDEHSEAFGQTYVECLAAGVPLVATRSGIGNEILRNEENCLVVAYKDSDAIFSALFRVLGDVALQKRLREAGWESVKNDFTIQQMMRKLELLYERP